MTKLLLRVDGSCIPNPGNMAVGIVIYKDGELWKKISDTMGMGTNNIAEYLAVIRGLEEIKDIPADSVEFYCDSQLIVKQLNGQFKVKNPKMIPLYERIQKLLTEIKAPIFFIWNRREENHLADQLARKLLIKDEQNKRTISSRDLIVDQQGDYFLVKNIKTKKSYRVNLETPECDCYDFVNNCQKWQLECKHIIAAREYLKNKEVSIVEKAEKDREKMKILIISKMTSQEKWLKLLEKYNQKDLLPIEIIFPETDREKFKQQLTTAQVVVGGELSESELFQAKKLELFQIPFTGVDRQNLRIFKKFPRIVVCNTHGNKHAVAELAFCLLLAIVKNLVNNDRDLRLGKWHGVTSGEPSVQLYGRKLGIIGFGSVGKEIAKRAHSFGMEIYAIKRLVELEELAETYGLSFLGSSEQLDYVIAQSDFIIIALPLTRQTENIINDRILNQMKGKYLINIGRGRVIEEKALYSYLKNKYLAGAAIDTWYQYPDREKPEMLPSQYPFHELSNIIMSPHNAGYTDKAIEENVLAVYENIKRIFYGQEPLNKVDLDEGY